jgi:hypothetical protein
MKLVRCDQCAKEAEAAEPFGTPPSDWFLVRQQGGAEKQLCSAVCVRAHATEAIAKELQPA